MLLCLVIYDNDQKSYLNLLCTFFTESNKSIFLEKKVLKNQGNIYDKVKMSVFVDKNVLLRDMNFQRKKVIQLIFAGPFEEKY